MKLYQFLSYKMVKNIAGLQVHYNGKQGICSKGLDSALPTRDLARNLSHGNDEASTNKDALSEEIEHKPAHKAPRARTPRRFIAENPVVARLLGIRYPRANLKETKPKEQKMSYAKLFPLRRPSNEDQKTAWDGSAAKVEVGYIKIPKLKITEQTMDPLPVRRREKKAAPQKSLIEELLQRKYPRAHITPLKREIDPLPRHPYPKTNVARLRPNHPRHYTRDRAWDGTTSEIEFKDGLTDAYMHPRRPTKR